MTSNPRQVTITLTPAQDAALSELSITEQCDIEALVLRGVDTFLATYRANAANTALEAKVMKLHDHTLKVLVSAMKLIGQTLYFSSLPVTTGPVKSKLNREGILLQWQQSERFATDLLKPPPTPESRKIKTLDA